MGLTMAREAQAPANEEGSPSGVVYAATEVHQPVDCGVLLYRDAAAARLAFSFSGDYVRSLSTDTVESFAFFEESLELSRRGGAKATSGGSSSPPRTSRGWISVNPRARLWAASPEHRPPSSPAQDGSAVPLYPSTSQ